MLVGALVTLFWGLMAMVGVACALAFISGVSAGLRH